jgi:hypothetical protein
MNWMGGGKRRFNRLPVHPPLVDDITDLSNPATLPYLLGATYVDTPKAATNHQISVLMVSARKPLDRLRTQQRYSDDKGGIMTVPASVLPAIEQQLFAPSTVRPRSSSGPLPPHQEHDTRLKKITQADERHVPHAVRQMFEPQVVRLQRPKSTPAIMQQPSQLNK